MSQHVSRAATLMVVCTAHFLMPFMMSAVGVALPSIGRDFNASAMQLGLVETTYVLSASIFLLAMGRMGDIHGRRKIFQYGTQQRSSNHCRFGCELVRSGRIGDIRHVHVVAPNSGPGGNTKPLPVPEGLDYDMWLGPAPWAPYTYQRCRPWTKDESYSIWYHISDYCLGGIGGAWAGGPALLVFIRHFG